MNAVIDFYQREAKASRSTIPWVAGLQDARLKELTAQGFPTRHDEDWKYTPLNAFLNEAFQRPSFDDTAPPWVSDIPLDHPVTIQNGHVLSMDGVFHDRDDGVWVLPLFDAITQHEDKVKPYFDRLLTHAHGFHALNTAGVTTGVVVYVPAGVCVQDPIALTHWQDKNQAVHTRHIIILEEGSEASVCEDYAGSSQCPYFTNTVTEVFLANHAKLTHYTVQREGHFAYHVGQVSVCQARGSHFTNHSLSLGGQWVRSDVHVQFQEEGGHCFLNGVYAPKDGQHMDHHTTIHHQVASCQSEQNYKGILSGRSRAVFNGKVIVSKGAQHTQAKQHNKNLLLSNNAEIDTKPQLDIDADDVVCTHGATVGQLDDDALFYFQTRGIAKDEASRYMIEAFVKENLQFISHKNLFDWMSLLCIQQWKECSDE